MTSSRIPGFYKLSPKERLDAIVEFSGLSEEDRKVLEKSFLTVEQADKMIENAVGSLPVPLGFAANFLINGKDYLVPMATEEPSVIAAASNAAKICRVKGGVKSETTSPIMIGQIHLSGVSNQDEAERKILSEKERIIETCNSCDSTLVRLGGGAKDLEIRKLEKTIVVHLLVDCRDAMGANAVNTMAEKIAPVLEELSGGKAVLRILSNLAVHRLVKSSAVFDKEELGGEDVVDAIVEISEIAKTDIYRASTHNKGVMNGISALVLATGNDTRAVEAGVHSYAGRGKSYLPVTSFRKNSEGDLVGELEIPMAVGIVGGATKNHPIARANLNVLGVSSASELAEIIGAVGLCQNLAALKALASEGIQKGHMKLHSKKAESEKTGTTSGLNISNSKEDV
ncbi:TPA: hydroxymethylglutaryl-CoA reductase, degradative [archaeon]|jgi:hydroxymethylglutaryl-CoA reductase|uniref:3-hydroxy-3-methylglutaryl coenzyme A reductase n=1 Tax=Candidatus Undinarchaeum marinum TaxID=2756141 RepID=A0A832XG76_9ARCH|nr:hydroxymethylglutaryl-CoA reductase, degradative [Candidatus Undinarchaeum marinum]